MSITREFKLPLFAGRSVPLVVNANQYDQGETWLFTLYDETGQKYTPSTGAIVGLKSDDHVIANAGTVNSSGQVVITETEQMTASPGKNIYEVLIDSDTHGTANFTLLVEPRPGDQEEPSDSDLSMFQEAIDAAATIGDVTDLVDDVAVLSARMDTFTHLTDGSTTGDAELADIRVGADGTTYPTAGDAVRTQISDLKNAFDDVSEFVLPENHIISSSDYAWGIANDMTVTYGDNSVSFEYPYASGNKTNFGFIFNGLQHGKTYVLSFDVTSGAIASAKISGLDGTKSNVLYATIASCTNTENHYTCEFNAYFSSQTFYDALNITMARATSTTATLSNLSLTLKDETSHYEIDRDAVKNLTEESFSDEVQAKLDYSTLAYSDDNLIDTSNVTHGYINASNGTISNTGSSNAVTDFIPVEAGKTYYFNNVLYGYYAFYTSDSESAFLSGQIYIDERSNWYLTIPSNATYARFTVDETKLATTWMNTINREPLNKDVVVLNDNILTTGEYPSNPCDYDGFEISLFNKIICVGDSLTEGVCNYTEGGQSIGNVAFPNYAYPKLLAKLTGCTVDNKGRAGYTIKQWYDYYQNTDLSGYDMAIIQLGINDALQDGWTQEAEDSMTAIINKLKSDNNKIKIFVATLIPAFAYSGTRFNAVSEAIRTYVSGLNDADVMLLDMAVYAHTKELKAYNNGHLTGFGYLRLAKDYKAYISRVINLNPEKFREVQFIGTDHDIS